MQDTKRRIFELVEASGLLQKLVRLYPEPATKEDVLRFHTAKYVEMVIEGSKQQSGFDLDDGVSHVSPLVHSRNGRAW